MPQHWDDGGRLDVAKGWRFVPDWGFERYRLFRTVERFTGLWQHEAHGKSHEEHPSITQASERPRPPLRSLARYTPMESR